MSDRIVDHLACCVKKVNRALTPAIALANVRFVATKQTWDDALRRLVENNWSVGATFALDDVYKFEKRLGESFPNNHRVRQKIRQVLQHLRDDGMIQFIDNRGNYQRIK